MLENSGLADGTYYALGMGRLICCTAYKVAEIDYAVVPLRGAGVTITIFYQ